MEDQTLSQLLKTYLVSALDACQPKSTPLFRFFTRDLEFKSNQLKFVPDDLTQRHLFFYVAKFHGDMGAVF